MSPLPPFLGAFFFLFSIPHLIVSYIWVLATTQNICRNC